MKRIFFAIVFLVSFDFINLHSEQSNKTINIGDTVNGKNNQNSYDVYAENVHMYICIQALNLLKDKFPNVNFSVLESHIGTMNDCGTAPWQTGTITAGACREDREDIVFGISGPFGWFASNTHFWDSDNRTNGDHSLTTLNILGINYDYPNAFTKMKRYIDGQWFKWNGSSYGVRNYITFNPGNGFFYRFSYHTRGLIEFFKTKKIYCYSYTNTLGQETIVNDEIILDDNVFNRLIWQILGRFSHLMTDISVPAHVKNDVHVREWDGGDCYHNFADDNGYLNYNWITAKNAGGFFNPYENQTDPIRYLAYTTSQLADHYPSGPDCLEIPQQHFGNNNLPGGTNPMIQQYYQELGPAPPNITDLYAEGSRCFNHAIRATAGLFYWFAVETGIITTDPLAFPHITGFSLNSADYDLYHGEGKTLTCNATGSNVNYSYRLRVCETDNPCYAPVPGISLQPLDKRLKFTNISFRNYFTCGSFDSICSITGHSSVYQSPATFYIEATAFNQFGHDTKIYEINNPHKFFPNEKLRPPPTGGCPFAAVKDTDQFIYINNVLPKSEFKINLGKDIEDKLILTSSPYIDPEENLITIAVSESGIDTDNFDKVELLSVEHPSNTILGITENNDLVLYSPAEVLSPKYAEISGNDVTSELAYDSAFTKTVKGVGKDRLNLEYSLRSSPDANNLSNSDEQGTDSIAIIFDPFAYEFDLSNTYEKDNAGNIIAYDFDGNSNSRMIEFSKREMRSVNIIPVFAKKDIKSVETVWKHEFRLSFFSTCRVYFYGYEASSLDLVSAENSVSGDILKQVSQLDKLYTSIDSNSYIELKFKSPGNEPAPGMKRDFVFAVDGRSFKTGSNGTDHSGIERINHKVNDSYNQNRLNDNYPNPFNPRTVISYEISGDKNDFRNVKLVIYDALGKEASVLVNEKQNPGSYSVLFDGTNLPSGIYFYKLQSDDFAVVKKMILLK